MSKKFVNLVKKLNEERLSSTPLYMDSGFSPEDIDEFIFEHHTFDIHISVYPGTRWEQEYSESEVNKIHTDHFPKILIIPTENNPFGIGLEKAQEIVNDPQKQKDLTKLFSDFFGTREGDGYAEVNRTRRYSEEEEIYIRVNPKILVQKAEIKQNEKDKEEMLLVLTVSWDLNDVNF